MKGNHGENAVREGGSTLFGSAFPRFGPDGPASAWPPACGAGAAPFPITSFKVICTKVQAPLLRARSTEHGWPKRGPGPSLPQRKNPKIPKIKFLPRRPRPLGCSLLRPGIGRVMPAAAARPGGRARIFGGPAPAAGVNLVVLSLGARGGGPYGTGVPHLKVHPHGAFPRGKGRFAGVWGWLGVGRAPGVFTGFPPLPSPLTDSHARKQASRRNHTCENPPPHAPRAP